MEEYRKNRTAKERAFFWITGVLCLLFFLFFAFHDGPVICVDSESYITMDSQRDPVYPLFLSFFRTIVPPGTLYGQDAYLFYAVVVQSILNAVSVWLFGLIICRIAGEYRSRKIACLYGGIGVFCELMVRLINRFVAARGSMYSECIMSESLAMPLFTLYMGVLCLWILYHRKRDFAFLVILMSLLLLTRGQMEIVLVITVLTSLFHDGIRRASRSLKRVFLSLLAAGLAFVLFNACELSYFHMRYGIFMKTTNGSKAAACTLLYSADASDTALFDRYGTPEEKELFEQIIAQCGEQGLLKENLPDHASWLATAEHFAQSYDVIGFDVLPSVIRPYMDSDPAYASLSGIEYTRAYDAIVSDLNSVLIHQDKKDLIEVYADNILDGLITTNARVMPGLNEASIVIYGIYIALLVLLLRKGREVVTACSEIALLGVLINALVVGLVIFPQPRYMFYNMPTFWTMLLIQAAEVRRKEGERSSSSDDRCGKNVGA